MGVSCSVQAYQRTMENLLIEHLNLVLLRAAAAYYEVLGSIDTSQYQPDGAPRRTSAQAPRDPSHPNCQHGPVCGL
jgi:hypothetical protein